MNDRDILIGLFNAFGSYVQKQTGETFILCIKDDQGDIYHAYRDTMLVTWFNEQGEVVPPAVGSRGFSHRRCPLHGASNDTATEPQQVLER